MLDSPFQAAESLQHGGNQLLEKLNLDASRFLKQFEYQHLCQLENVAPLTELSIILSRTDAKWPLQNSSKCKLGCQIKSKSFFCFGLILHWCFDGNCKTEVKKQGSSHNIKTALQLIARYINSFCCELWQGIQPNTAMTGNIWPTSARNHSMCVNTALKTTQYSLHIQSG